MFRVFTRLPQVRIFKCLGYSRSMLKEFTFLPPTFNFKYREYIEIFKWDKLTISTPY